MRKTEREMLRQVLKRAQDDRMGAFKNLQAQGHVTVMNDEQPDVIRVRVDEEFFTDPRRNFPTAHLMARLQLAINAGQSDRNNTNPFFEKSFFMEEAYDYKTGGDYLYPNKWLVTATVNPKLRKGLRP